MLLTYQYMWYVVKFAGGERMWMFMSLFIALPACALCWYNANKIHEEEHHQGRPEFVKYPHLRMRTKVIYKNKY